MHLVTAIYDAAIRADYGRMQQLLTRGCFGTSAEYQAQLSLWHRPAVLKEMVALLRTHAAPTDGYTYPGFAMAGFQTSFDYADAAALHFKSPRLPTFTSSYTGPTIIIGYEPVSGYGPHTRTPPNWCGITYRS